MSKMYPGSNTAANFSWSPIIKAFFVSVLFITIFSTASSAQVLYFGNPVLESGVAGQDGAVYRFSSVNDTLDALVTINGRSGPQVTLVTLDDASAGYDNAFQPIVTYNNNVVNAATDWWMDFSITFVRAGTSQMANLMSFSSSALDIDGNGSRISEYVSFYYMQTFSVSDSSDLALSSLQEFVNGKFSLIGEKFVGPSTDYPGIDSSTTNAMVSTLYANIGSFRVRTGAQSTRASTGSTRDYSFTFATVAAAGGVLPVELVDWNVNMAPKGIELTWTAARELNASYYIIERSLDGRLYMDAATIATRGSGAAANEALTDYNYMDKVPVTTQGMVYYRLRVVEPGGDVKRSEVRAVKVGRAAPVPTVSVYPNPVVTTLAVNVPMAWQNKALYIDVFNTSGRPLLHLNYAWAGETQKIDVKDLATGMYIVRVSNGVQAATQEIFKAK